jgi:hypothetical protein
MWEAQLQETPLSQIWSQERKWLRFGSKCERRDSDGAIVSVQSNISQPQRWFLSERLWARLRIHLRDQSQRLGDVRRKLTPPIILTNRERV